MPVRSKSKNKRRRQCIIICSNIRSNIHHTATYTHTHGHGGVRVKGYDARDPSNRGERYGGWNDEVLKEEGCAIRFCPFKKTNFSEESRNNDGRYRV